MNKKPSATRRALAEEREARREIPTLNTALRAAAVLAVVFLASSLNLLAVTFAPRSDGSDQFGDTNRHWSSIYSHRLYLSNDLFVTSITTNGSLTGNSDQAIPTEKAVKSYVDSQTVTNVAETLVSHDLRIGTNSDAIVVITNDVQALADIVDGLSALSLFGATNAHPTIGGAYSLYRDLPATAWASTNVCTEGTNYVGTFLLTNGIDHVRSGAYVGNFFAIASQANKTYGVIKMIEVSSDGVTTNQHGSEGRSGYFNTVINQRSATVSEPDSHVTTNVFLGVEYYIVQEGVAAVTVVTWGGDGYATHLDTPGVGAIAGYATDAELAVLQTQVDDLQTGTNAAFLVSDSDGGRVGLYTTFDSAIAACPDDGLTECIRLGQYDWTYNILPSNGVTILGHGGLTLHQTNQNQYIIISLKTNTFSGVTFKSATTNATTATLFIQSGVGHFSHCVFTNVLSPAKPGLGLNGGTANLRDTDLQGLIHEFGGASTVNDYGGSVWSSTTVDVTNYYGSALTIGGYTAAQFFDNANQTNRPATDTWTTNMTNLVTFPVGLLVGTGVVDQTRVAAWDAGGGGGSGSSAHTYMIGTGQWGGDEVGAGSLGSGTNNVVWAGYSTANATNNVNAGDAWYSSQIVLNDKYYFGQFTFERDTSLALESLWIGVRSSATSPLTNKVNILFDDTVSIFATNNLCSSSANVWNWYGPYETSATLPVSWTNTLPTWVNGVRTNFGLNVRADVFCSHSNTIQLKVESRINTP